MRQVLVVANQTLVGSHLTSRVHELSAIDPISVFLLVPATPRLHGDHDSPATADPSGLARASANLAAGITAFAKLGIEVSGQISQPDPMAAVHEALREHPGTTLIIVSTLPLGNSRWLAMDLPHRLARRYHDIAVEHLVGTPIEPPAPPNERRRRVQILLVEDNDADIELTRHALSEAPAETDLQVVRNGAEAIELLEVARPDLILLDLKMPILDGHETLQQLTSGLGLDTLNTLNIVIVSSSASDKDRQRAHALGARAYIVKNPDFALFQATLASLVAEIADR